MRGEKVGSVLILSSNKVRIKSWVGMVFLWGCGFWSKCEKSQKGSFATYFKSLVPFRGDGEGVVWEWGIWSAKK